MARITSFRETGPRYPTLRVAGFFCALIGAIVMVVGLGLVTFIGLQAVAARGGPVDTSLQVAAGFYLLWAFGILFAGLQLIALAGFLRLMIHLEENTRATAQALDRIRSGLEARQAGAGPLFGA